jgi:hypothetical protein
MGNNASQTSARPKQQKRIRLTTSDKILGFDDYEQRPGCYGDSVSCATEAAVSKILKRYFCPVDNIDGTEDQRLQKCIKRSEGKMGETFTDRPNNEMRLIDIIPFACARIKSLQSCLDTNDVCIWNNGKCGELLRTSRGPYIRFDDSEDSIAVTSPSDLSE